jgi:hypothetical protein
MGASFSMTASQGPTRVHDHEPLEDPAGPPGPLAGQDIPVIDDLEKWIARFAAGRWRSTGFDLV